MSCWESLGFSERHALLHSAQNRFRNDEFVLRPETDMAELSVDFDGGSNREGSPELKLDGLYF